MSPSRARQPQAPRAEADRARRDEHQPTPLRAQFGKLTHDRRDALDWLGRAYEERSYWPATAFDL